MIRYLAAIVLLTGAFTFATVREIVNRDCSVLVTESSSQDEAGKGTFSRETRTVCR